MPPKVTLVARPGLCDPDELPGTPGKLSPYARILDEGGDPAEIPAVRDGRAGVQDEGSQIVAITLAEAQLDGDGHPWLDLCAGPGGKAALLGAWPSSVGRGWSRTRYWSTGPTGPPRRAPSRQRGRDDG